MAQLASWPIKDRKIGAFREQMRGEVLDPASPSYDATRAVWNAMTDRRPGLIARCRPEFVICHGVALRFGRKD